MNAMLSRAVSALFIKTTALFFISFQAVGQIPTAPPEVRQSQPQAALHGQAMLRFLGMDIYEARLWAQDAFALERYAQQPFALELQYRKSLSGRLIAQRSVTEMRRQSDFDPKRAPDWQSQMQTLFPDVKPGDRITGLFALGGGTRFFFNGRLLGEVSDPLFARLFFGIWLSPETSEPEMRCALARCTP